MSHSAADHPVVEPGLSRQIYRRLLFGFGAALAMFMLALLVRDPMPVARQKYLCVINMQIAPHVRLLINCDSAEFMALGYDPSRLLEPGNARQSRPLFIAAAHALSWPFEPIGWLLRPLLPSDTGPNARNAEKLAFGLQNMLPVYLAYLTINIAALAGAWLLLLRSIPVTGSTRKGVGFALLCVGPLLFANDVCKAFLWSPHTQMLNILVPTLAFVLIARPPSSRGVVAIAAAAGIGMLAYANMVLLFAALAIGLVLRPGLRAEWLGRVGVLLIAAVVFAAPSIAWGAIVRALIGSYNVIEFQKYNEVVWIGHAWQAGPTEFVTRVASMSWFFTRTALIYAIPAAIFFALAAGLAVRSGDDGFARWWSGVRPSMLPALLASGLGLGFVIVIGWPSERLAFAAIPPLIVLAAIGWARLIAMRPQPLSIGERALLTGMILIQCAYVVIKDGPWS